MLGSSYSPDYRRVKMLGVEQSAGKLCALCYLTGVYLGDGWLGYSRTNRNWWFRLDTIDKDFADSVARNLEILLSRRPNIRYKTERPGNRKPIYCITISASPLRFLIEDTWRKQKIPNWILNLTNKDAIKSFIAGIMDSEGWVSVSRHKHLRKNGVLYEKNVYQLGVTASDGWIVDFIEFLRKQGVKTGVLKRMKTVTGKKQMLRFLINKWSWIENGLYFTVQRKQRRIEEFSLSSKHWHNKRINPSETIR